MSAGIRAPSFQPSPGTPTEQAQDGQWETPSPPVSFSSREAREDQGLHLPRTQPALGWATLGLCSPFSKWPPAGHAWAATPPAWSCHPPFLLSTLLNMGRGGGLTETVSPVVSPYRKRPLPLSMAWGGIRLAL